MTKDECGKFLNELISIYPNLLRKEIDLETLANMWFEVLQNEDYTKTHNALAHYFRTDKSGFPPTAGQILPPAKVYMSDEEQEEILKNIVWE